MTLPALADVKGGFNLQTSGQLDCGPFEEAAARGVIKGEYVCAARQSDPGTVGNPITEPGAQATKKAAAGQLSVNTAAVFGMASVAVGVLSMLM